MDADDNAEFTSGVELRLNGSRTKAGRRAINTCSMQGTYDQTIRRIASEIQTIVVGSRRRSQCRSHAAGFTGIWVIASAICAFSAAFIFRWMRIVTA